MESAHPAPKRPRFSPQQLRDMAAGVALQAVLVGVGAAGLYLLARSRANPFLIAQVPNLAVVLSLVALVVVARRRPSVALGMLLFWAGTFALGLLAGVIAAAACFVGLS